MNFFLSIDWLGLVAILFLWFITVLVSVGLLGWLFPRIERGEADSSAQSDVLPWYPIPPRVRQLLERRHQLGPIELPSVDPAYWRKNLRVIVALLVIWLSVSVGSVVFAPWLNNFRILTGFPLGYYMGAQGAIIVFIGIIVGYAWHMARLDRRYRTSPEPNSAGIDSKKLGIIFLLFTIGFILFVAALGVIESVSRQSSNTLGWALLIASIGLYAIIGATNRAHSLDEYFVAGRRVPAFFNGMAMAGDWMSAATFVSMAGTLWLLGYEGLAYIIGWTGGYVLLVTLLAPYLRKFGQYTIPDFVAARYEGTVARMVSALIGVIISFTYVTAQVTGIGIIMTRFLGVNYLVGVAVGMGAVLFCSYLGGMRAITWTQAAQAIVLVIAYLIPVTLLSFRDTGIPIPQIMYGQALEQIVRLEPLQGITDSYVMPFTHGTIFNFIALMLCLMMGTAGLPHILVRFYTVPDPGAARRSVGWAMLFIAMVYLTAPAYAAFSRWEILQNVIGKPIGALPDWAINWANAGLIAIKDINGDGILQFGGLRIDPDVVVLATPEIAGLPQTIAALVAAGGLAAALSTADGLLLVIASALSHDFYAHTMNPTSSPHTRLLLSRIAVLIAAVLAALVAVRRLGIIVQLVAWAFSFAASTLFPILVLGIFWKRANGRGAVAGMIAGFFTTLTYMLLNSLNPNWNILGITNVAAGIFGMPVNFAVAIIVSKLTPPPPPEVVRLVESLRQP
ncbi:MAG: VC_2705 family sodium/solute symporter [Chloroflexi bacterium]|nr:VC_2705 family sodium/solute symporter [Chloroflexota bacterium]